MFRTIQNGRRTMRPTSIPRTTIGCRSSCCCSEKLETPKKEWQAFRAKNYPRKFSSPYPPLVDRIFSSKTHRTNSFFRHAHTARGTGRRCIFVYRTCRVRDPVPATRQRESTGVPLGYRPHVGRILPGRVFFSKINTNCDNGIKTNFGRPRSRPDNNFVTHKLVFHANGPHLSRTIKLQRRTSVYARINSRTAVRRDARLTYVRTYPYINVYYFERFKKDRSLCRSKSRLRLRAGPGRAAACVHAAL